MKKRDLEIDLIQSDFILGRLSRRQALRALGAAGLVHATWPLVPMAQADEAGKQTGPGGIALARPGKPVRLPLHRDPIKAGLKPEGGKFYIYTVDTQYERGQESETLTLKSWVNADDAITVVSQKLDSE